MFNPVDDRPVLKLYREPVKEETQDQITIKELREQLAERDQAIARLAEANRALQAKVDYQDIKKENDSVKGFLLKTRPVVENGMLYPNRAGEKLTIDAGTVISTTAEAVSDGVSGAYKENPCKDLLVKTVRPDDPSVIGGLSVQGIGDCTVFYSMSKNMIEYIDAQGNVIKTVPCRDAKDLPFKIGN